MAEQAYTYALTTVARVKSRLQITDSGFDAQFLRYVNEVTDFIERYCGRRFAETTYTNEVYSVDDYGIKDLALKNGPVSTVSSFQYRAGLPSNPTWTDFPTDSWQLRSETEMAVVHSDQDLPKGINTVRATYVGGYKISFANFGDATTHTLPADLTQVAEKLCVKAHKKRDAEGKTIEDFNGSRIQWDRYIDDDIRAMLEPFRRNVQFV